MKYFVFSFSLILALSSSLKPQISDTPDSTNTDSDSFYFFPLIYWTPQTRLAGGLVGTYVYRTYSDGQRSVYSSFSASGIYTQKKQILLAAGIHRYIGTNRFAVETQYMEYPDWFWGIGNQTPDSASEHYTPRQVSVAFHYSRQYRQGMYYGISFEFDLFRIIRYKSNGLIELIGYGDRRTRVTSGLGPTFQWDTRDKNLYPSTGVYHQLSLMPFLSVFGNHYSFVRFRFDLRKYYSLFDAHVIAGQWYGQWLLGKSPINKYAELGGYNLMRGYYPGRYRDRQMMAAQIEYRLPVFWRFGLVAFAGMGDVAKTLSDFRNVRLKYSKGFGIRFTLNRDNHLNLRVDMALQNRMIIPVLAFGEAF